MLRKKYIIIKLSAIIFFLAGHLPAISQPYKNNFTSGEKLRFVIYYGIVDAGIVETELSTIFYNGNKIYHSKLLAKTTGLADRLYRIRDEYQSFFHPETLLPQKAIRDISEGRYKRYQVDHYDHENSKVFNLKGEVFDIPLNTRDMVSVFFYVRNIDFSKLQDGDLIKIITFFDDEIFPFDMRYRGTEVIKTRKGTFNCVKLVPYVEPGRIFNKEDDMTIWISNDRNRVPIRVRFDLKVGSVKCDLIEFSGLKY